MHVTVLAVGKVKEKFLREGIAEYAKRLRSYVRLKIIELPDEALRQDQKKAKETEGEKILKEVKDGAYMVVLDPKGKQISSEELGQWFGAREMSGQEVVLVIGGASGLADKVKNRADEALSFSRLTFPHQLFRLILMEQMYRAYKILRGEPYHL
ncbi:MAG TPA: 23S rRNA (pseudouridine(1915)-N(3))-methyltransferase RlmH [Firmicutes bacterium]|nr:23S rRNA (pseudouridine(1915)-N(3))-methyltransferase RlmH [Bacillota bacterium]